MSKANIRKLEKAFNHRLKTEHRMKCHNLEFELWFAELCKISKNNGLVLQDYAYYKPWFNSGYSPQEIADNIDEVHTPHHP